MSETRALLFDFDGVLADSEPIHLRMFQKILSEEGITLTRDEYYQKYLGLDDRGTFRAVFGPLPDGKLEELIRRKNEKMLTALQQESLLAPEATGLIESCVGRYFLAIVSGAFKNEIEEILRYEKLAPHFQVILGAGEVTHGKPDPEGYLKAVQILNRDFVPPSEILLPEECLVIEDSPWGIEAARAAGIPSVALTTSYAPEQLKGAQQLFSSLDQLKMFLL